MSPYYSGATKMKKVVLSAIAAMVVSGVASADALTLYSDPKTGQVYTTPGEGRVEMGDFISAKDVDLAQRESESAFSEYKDAQKKYVNVKSKAKTLEFSGTHYLGYTYADTKTEGTVNPPNSAGFEMRRNYVQVKAFFNDKDYVRVTMDATKELASDPGTASEKTSQNSGYADVFVKYAYLYLDNVLPYTGVEAGIAHRPWIDYEEHNGWYYRSFAKVLIEPKATATENGPDLVNSADFGVNFKTKTSMFSSELGIYNGEGYHADKTAANQEATTDMSFEWRLTGHILGDGTKVGKNDLTKDTYLHVSTYGLMSKNHKDESNVLNQSISQTSSVVGAGEYNRNMYGFHAVYNQPAFLIAAQYVINEDDYQDSSVNKNTKAWSINGEYRPFTDWTVIGRYDNVMQEVEGSTTASQNVETMDLEKIIYGVAYKYSKNVTFLATATQSEDPKMGAASSTVLTADKNVYQLTTEIKW